MKKTKIALTLALTALAAVVITTGCGTLDSLYEEQVSQLPGEIIGTNTVFTTNTVMVAAAQTNDVTGEITPAVLKEEVTPVITYEYSPPRYQTNLVPKAFVAGAIETTSALPFPFAGAAGLVVGFLYSAYAAVRNRKATKALVLGIEAGRKFLNETPEGRKLDAVIKDKLIEHQEAAGVLNEVGKLVNTYTTNTVS